MLLRTKDRRSDFSTDNNYHTNRGWSAFDDTVVSEYHVRSPRPCTMKPPLTEADSTANQEPISTHFLPREFEVLFIYLFIYYFPTIKITQALHYTKMWRGDLRKPQGLYEEAPSLQ